MRGYLFGILVVLAAFIVSKCELRDRERNRWRLSSGENRIGFALLSAIFIAASALLLCP